MTLFSFFEKINSNISRRQPALYIVSMLMDRVAVSQEPVSYDEIVARLDSVGIPGSNVSAALAQLQECELIEKLVLVDDKYLPAKDFYKGRRYQNESGYLDLYIVASNPVSSAFLRPHFLHAKV